TIMPGYIEIVDFAQAVAAQLQRVCQHAYAVLADVEGVASEVWGPRVTIWHHHVDDRCAVEYWSLPALVLVGRGVENQTLTRREADAEMPLLPMDVMAVDDETGALRLMNLDGLQISPCAGDGWGVVRLLHR